MVELLFGTWSVDTTPTPPAMSMDTRLTHMTSSTSLSYFAAEKKIKGELREWNLQSGNRAYTQLVNLIVILMR
jgi:hypothetical protein